ncbi:MAG: S8 family serine peptidase [Promethearchaeota archaeon]|nr:MAG: S8 family serine peptidase [Candidatus Lokiarchaeota archaeon]
MTKLKKKKSLLILSVIFVSYFFIPMIGVQLITFEYYDQNLKSTVDLESLPSSLFTQADSNNFNSEVYNGIEGSKYDDLLKEFLLNQTRDQNNNFVDTKIIVLFEDYISKENRITILDSIFEDYKILSNYDIIPGVYLRIDYTQLISNEKKIHEISAIKKIYKSKIYQLPYFSDDTPQLSALNIDDYSNWWLNAIGAENLAYNGTGVRVAILDTGIYSHPDLTIINSSNFVADEFFEDDVMGHGTHVAGIVGSDGGGSLGKYRGVAPGVQLINARVLNSSGAGEDGDIINGIQWSSKPTRLGGAGADIVSMSFGWDYPIISDSITQAITNAKNDFGVIFVSSAGNSGPEYFTASTPASGIDVISVGATDENDNLASFSSWGPTFSYIGYPDVVAPGVNIISTEAIGSIISKEERYRGEIFDFSGDADYIPLSGTSMSCPIVSGALAILLEAYPYITPETARIALLEGARKLPNEYDDDFLKSGAGIINVSESLNYLSELGLDYNDTAKFYPNELPVKPYDLLHFPGDHQKFNLTIISGKNNTYNFNISSGIQGITISLNKPNLSFSDSGIDFLELELEIDNDATPGIRNFQLNLTDGAHVYDVVNITLDIRLPEHKILMESYHGLNDWFPEFSYYQMGFYDAMADLAELNISIDYNMEYWTPDYNKNLNNSILTEERLAQYDIIFLQSPILPYSPLEIKNLKEYFENGGNLLFLGTRYQDLVVENINYLFSRLNVSIQINEENIMNDNWIGIGATVSSQGVNNLNNTNIFQDVDKFYWLYGNSFTVSNNAEPIATINNKTVAALYDGNSQGKGKFLAFGDLHWIFENYKTTNYIQDHFNLLKNVIEFFLPTEDISINIDLDKYRNSNPKIDLSIYLKNQTSESPLTLSDFTSLEVSIKNESYSTTINLNTTLNINGIYFNDSFDLPYPSYTPYSIEVNLTIGPKEYNKTTKIVYIKQNEVPKIIDLSSDLPPDDPSITRANGVNTNLIAEMDKPTYGNIEGYLSIYSYSFYNNKKSVNKTLTFSHTGFNYYTNIFDPNIADPSGYAIYFIIPINTNYTNPNSPRYTFQIINNPPEILKSSSTFNFGRGDIAFEDTETDEYSYFYQVSQGTTFNFKVDVEDSVTYEDLNSDMRVFINLFIFYLTDQGIATLIVPSTYEVEELYYQLPTDKFEGTFTIPDSMRYNTITGEKLISTVSSYDTFTDTGFIGILYMTVYDSEGEFEDFIIALLISERPIDPFMIIIIVISIIALIGIVGMSIYYARRKKYPKVTQYYYKPSYEEPEERYITPEPLSQLGQFYCPFCGNLIAQPKKFCPHCGESLAFFRQDE